jgi:hypothetical protein
MAREVKFRPDLTDNVLWVHITQTGEDFNRGEPFQLAAMRAKQWARANGFTSRVRRISSGCSVDSQNHSTKYRYCYSLKERD